ncbi:MAG: acyl-CoA dehydrogenase family protein [Sphingobium sp.]
MSEEQTAIQDAVRGTLGDTWPMERLHKFSEAGEDFDPTSWAALAQLGLFGILAPDSGMSLLDAALVSEVAGEVAAPGPVIGQMIAVAAISASDNDAAKAFLDGLISGETVATLAIDSDLVQSASSAQIFLADDGAGGLRLIEAGEGVDVETLTPTDRSRPVSRVTFGKGVKSHALFESGNPIIGRLRDAALVLIAADALGGAQHCTDLSVDYAKERTQFGQPIGRFQALKHQLAHMALDVEPARALVWYGAYAWDAELPDAPRAAAMAKAHLCEVFTRTTRAAIAAHGGIGYTWEYGLNYWFRRSVYDRSWLGSPAVQRARAAELAGW